MCIHQYAGKSPFFVYVAYNAPHGPLQAKKEDLLRYGFDENKPLFPHKGAYGQKGRGNNKRQTYSAMVTCMDRGVGQILQALKDMHIDQNTLVLFLSDNGAQKGAGGSSGALRGWKFQEWAGGVRSPAIIRWPSGLKGGREIDQVAGYVDVMPTFLNLAGVKEKPKKPFDGINILPVLKGKVKQIDRYFYLGYGAIIHGPWQLVTANAGNSAMKEQKDLLFNILKDSTEHNNVIEKQPDIYKDLQRAVLPFDQIKPAHEVPSYGQGRKGFVAPKDWIITK